MHKEHPPQSSGLRLSPRSVHLPTKATRGSDMQSSGTKPSHTDHATEATTVTETETEPETRKRQCHCTKPTAAGRACGTHTEVPRFGLPPGLRQRAAPFGTGLRRLPNRAPLQSH